MSDSGVESPKGNEEAIYVERPPRILVGSGFEPITDSSLIDRSNKPLFLDKMARNAVFEHAAYGLREFKWGLLRRQIDNYVVDLKKKHPDLPEEEIESVCDLLFGPFRLDQEMLLPGERNEYKKELNARLQHNMAHGIIFASSYGARDEYTEAVFSTVNTIDSVANTQKGHKRGLKAFWNGVKTEVALMRALLANGYSLTLPDYSQDPSEVEDKDNEVLQLDVRNGVDMIAAKDGYAFLIDAKGRRNGDQAYGFLVKRKPLGGLPYILKNRYETLLGRNRVARLTVFVDTSFNSLPNLAKQTKTIHDRRRALAQFGVSEYQKEIGKGIERHLILLKTE